MREFSNRQKYIDFVKKRLKIEESKADENQNSGS